MAQATLETTRAPSAPAAAATAVRLAFIDHWRAALTVLVVLHHVALVYGAAAPYYYVDPPLAESLATLALFVFVLFNQAWFMGAFFLIAGYFTPGSFDRKGPAAFLRNRLLRLGVPLLLFAFVLGPLADIGLFLDPAPLINEPLTWESYWRIYPLFIGLGVAWFLALLLVFSAAYTLWRALVPRDETAAPPALPGYAAAALFTLALAVASYLFRLVIPLGRTVLQFPTLAYLPQYLSFFVLGVVAYRGDWLRALPRRMGQVGFGMAVLASLLLFPAALASLFSRGEAAFMGGGTWQSAAYALWDAAFAVGMCLAAITFFRTRLNTPNPFGSFLASQSYAVYVLHSPIVVAAAYGLYLLWARLGLTLGPLLKFGIASLLIVPICFLVAAGLRRLPGVSRVL